MRSKRTLVTVVLALALSAPAALAAHPKKGRAYVGNIAEAPTHVSKRVVVKVAKNGKSGKAALKCGSGRTSSHSRRFKIARSGRFKAVNKVGSLLVWRLKGKFVSRRKAGAKLYLPATCDGKGGKLTLKLK